MMHPVKPRWSLGRMIQRVLRERYVAQWITGLVTFGLLFGIMAVALAPDRYDLKVGDVAETTITATKDVEDVVTTNLRIQEALERVGAVYTLDASVEQAVMSSITASYGAFAQARTLYQERQQALAQQADPDEPSVPASIDRIMDEAFVKELEAVIAPVKVSNVVLRYLVTAPDATLSVLYSAVDEAVYTQLRQGIREEELAGAKEDIVRLLRVSLYSYSSNAQALSESLVRTHLKANRLFNAEATESARQEAQRSVVPTVYVKGQNIVQAGEVVNEAQHAMLISLGLLQSDTADYWMYIGLGGLLLVLLLVGGLGLRMTSPEVLRQPKLLLLIGVIMVLVVLVASVVKSINVYLIPTLLGVLLITTLVDTQVAMIVNLILALLLGVVAGGDTGMTSLPMYNVTFNVMLGGMLCVFLSKRTSHYRAQVLYTGLFAGVLNLATMLSVGLFTSSAIESVLRSATWSAGGALLSAVLCLGLQPLLEALFNLATPAKLMELCNPNQPLFKRLLMEAPGTYHHSVLVANLAESAAEQVGANPLLARVGAYYHDIGKLKRPSYFKENQLGENPHDKTDPYVSAVILTAHPRDGAQMAQKHKLPRPIIDIIQEHHGTSAPMYFYYKAKQMYQTPVNISEFRYEGPRPRSKEAAIIMLADTVEAAARAMKDHSTQSMDALIRKLIKGKIDDDQLSDTPLTMRDIARIGDSFLQVLSGVYHTRVEYPTEEAPSVPEVEARKLREPGDADVDALEKQRQLEEQNRTPEVGYPPAAQVDEQLDPWNEKKE